MGLSIYKMQVCSIVVETQTGQPLSFRGHFEDDEDAAEGDEDSLAPSAHPFCPGHPVGIRSGDPAGVGGLVCV